MCTFRLRVDIYFKDNFEYIYMAHFYNKVAQIDIINIRNIINKNTVINTLY